MLATETRGQEQCSRERQSVVEGTATLSAEPGSISVCGSLVTKSCPALVTPWTVALGTPLLMEFSRQECWNGLTFPSLGDLPNPGVEPASLASPSLAGRCSTTNAMWVFTFMPMPYYFD